MKAHAAILGSMGRFGFLRERARLLVICTIAVVALCTATMGWLRRLGAPQVTAPTTIVLITLDTLRADHLGCYGYPRAISPFIDELAGRGVLFTRAFAPMSTTSPSHASVFTGLYPMQHGVNKNGHVLDDSFSTLAESLRREGFITAGFVSTNVHFGPGNLDQGFAVFDEPRVAPREYRAAEQTVDRAIAWIGKQRAEGRLFLWVHLFDPHPPYNPAHKLPPQPGEDRRAFTQYLINQHRVDFEFFDRNQMVLLRFMDSYDGEVYAVDAAIERLFHRVEQQRADGDAVWLITSDHGEGLGNHRWLSHGKFIYNEQVRVPLVLYSSSRRFAGRRVEQVVELVDLFPTLAELAGVPVADGIPGLSGRSLLPLLSGEEGGYPKTYAFSERRTFDSAELSAGDIPEDSGYESGEKHSLQDAHYKYILWTAGEDEFYDLRSDPYEVENLIGAGHPEEHELRKALEEKIAALNRPAHEVAPVDEQTLERLRALGYAP